MYHSSSPAIDKFFTSNFEFKTVTTALDKNWKNYIFCYKNWRKHVLQKKEKHRILHPALTVLQICQPEFEYTAAKTARNRKNNSQRMPKRKLIWQKN